MGKWILLVLPLITVMREDLEAVIFVGRVSLGQPVTSIPIATIVSLICGLFCGFLIYGFASRTDDPALITKLEYPLIFLF
ncbi:Plasma membrane iron permease [Leucoagaricus sp. SymC.cos]|nr:Plasma membrane iron permease [Leucoagaricus sp. SymC.cos]